jgi:choline dehydrogenase
MIVHQTIIHTHGGSAAWNLLSIDHNAERSSAATGYVQPSGDNLHVLLNTHVTRLVPVGDNGADFRGVEFAASPASERRQLVAKKEAILAGGVIGSPQLLMLSGIGDRDELDAIGVKTLVDNPSVGKNLTDQVFTLALFNTTIQNTE